MVKNIERPTQFAADIQHAETQEAVPLPYRDTQSASELVTEESYHSKHESLKNREDFIRDPSNLFDNNSVVNILWGLDTLDKSGIKNITIGGHDYAIAGLMFKVRECIAYLDRRRVAKLKKQPIISAELEQFLNTSEIPDEKISASSKRTMREAMRSIIEADEIIGPNEGTLDWSSWWT